MEKFFHLSERGTDVRTEMMAGFTTFMAMAYILMVNAGMFAELEGQVTYNAVYIATAISAVVGTVLIGLLSNLPLAQAAGMGLNAYFVYTLCFGTGLSYANALVLVMVDGIIFILLTVTSLRKQVFLAIPNSVRRAIPAGIGLFIAFLGFQNAGIVVDSSTLVALTSLNMYSGNVAWGDVMPKLVTMCSLFAIAVMTKRGVRGSVLSGILGGAAAYYLLGLAVPGFYDGFAESMSFAPLAAFGEFFELSFGKVFTEGLDFSAYIAEHGAADFAVMFATSALALCMTDMFDTLGGLYGACSQSRILTPNGEIPKMNRAMLADAIATVTGAVCGTSTVTTYVESAAGVGEGGRTGLASMFTALLFAAAMFLSPLAQLIPSCATASALIYVGVMMMGGVRDIDWGDVTVAVPAFLTIAMMPFAYSISTGIAFGLVSHIFISAFTGRIREIKPAAWIVAILFGMTFFLTH